MKDQKPTNDSRKRHNEQLIRRMKAGESLWSYDSKASWFPPRPNIEKDPEAIKRLYNGSSSDPTATAYKDSTVRLIERRLKLVAKSSEDDNSEKTG